MGGAEEALFDWDYDLLWGQRKGFAKLALRTGRGESSKGGVQKYLLSSGLVQEVNGWGPKNPLSLRRLFILFNFSNFCASLYSNFVDFVKFVH